MTPDLEPIKAARAGRPLRPEGGAVSQGRWVELGVDRLGAILIVAMIASASSAEAACLMFEHRDFAGASLTIDGNRGLAQLGTLNDRVSSIKVAAQCLLVAYTDAQFAGAMTTFSPGQHAALPEGWDDRISSARCNCR